MSAPKLADALRREQALRREKKRNKALSRLMLGLISCLLLYEFAGTHAHGLSQLSAAMITAAAWLPAYLWCSQQRSAMPIYPLFASTFIWTYALPLVNAHPKVLQYSPDSHFSAALTVSSALLLGTLVWYGVVKRKTSPTLVYRGLSNRAGDRFFVAALLLAVCFNMALLGGWLTLLNIGFFAILQGATLGLSALAVFVLSYRLGRGELSRKKKWLFLSMVVTYCLSSALSLLLVQPASVALISIVAFTLGRKRFPFLPVILFLLCLSLLHYGKADMRAKYWQNSTAYLVQPWQYPEKYGEWIDYSLDYWGSQQLQTTQSGHERQSFVRRSSLIHLLLLAQEKSPTSVPFLNGQTYAILPQMVVPRVLNPNKLRSHEGTYLLNIHYGLQTRQATFTTTIGWGLMAEAYANYGIWGCWGLAVLLGAVYGKVAQLSVGKPILSAQSLIAVMVMTFAFQTEWSAGVYVAALCQSGLIVWALIFFLMKPRPFSEERAMPFDLSGRSA